MLCTHILPTALKRPSNYDDLTVVKDSPANLMYKAPISGKQELGYNRLPMWDEVL